MADATQSFENIDLLILNNRIREAIDGLFHLLAKRKAFQDIYQDLLVVSANFNNMTQEESLRLISFEDKQLTRSHLVKALIGLKTAALSRVQNDPLLQSEMATRADDPTDDSRPGSAQVEERPLAEITNDSFAPTIQAFNAEIDALTQEQFNVIQYLHYERRVRISGTAGSGKTLVAAEKAIRLSRSGTRVLFLCHNPLLADRVRQLVSGHRVDVIDFCTWVDNLLHIDEPNDPNFGWTHFQEPDSDSPQSRSMDFFTPNVYLFNDLKS